MDDKFESGFYNVEALLYLADEPVVSVYAQAQSYFLPAVPPWDTARSLFTFKSGAVASADFNCGLDHHFTGQELEAVAKGGALRLEAWTGSQRRERERDSTAHIHRRWRSGGAGRLLEWWQWQSE